jgi:serine/threonine-protein kinase
VNPGYCRTSFGSRETTDKGENGVTEQDRLLVTVGGGGSILPSGADKKTYSLPPSLLRKVSSRLRMLSVVGITLLSIGWIGVNLIEGELGGEFETPFQWLPNAVAFLASITVFGLTRTSRLPLSRVVGVGLTYEVVISWCIPLGEYWGVFRGIPIWYINSDVVGLSGVAIWMVFFTFLVPCRPRHALIALTLSAAAVPVTVGLLIWYGDMPAIPPLAFFLTFVFPYIICVILASLTARIIYGLGREVRQAQEMGSYRLTTRIGRGGMGEVWQATHNMLARPAAIKLVRSAALGSDPTGVQTAVARFEREAQVTATLQSPHTVELYDFGTSEDGSFYYVMEHLDGIDLESIVRRYGPQPAERTVHVLLQACHSLGEAHRRGLIHRDIKPSNIFLCERAFESDFVKVLDFGLVKRLADAQSGVDLTKAGLGGIAGTPSYIAPEVALGKETVDGRADIYGLGCVAFWLLTGRRVFEEDGAVAMILAHAHKTPDPPSGCAELPIPPDLDQLVLACLAKDPEARPSTAEELAEQLERISIEKPWTADRAAQWWEAHHPTQRG